ncbi:uncharacterized protein LOC106056901 isoform X2 [Biomphalaria glabrata]|uniref:Uncharacterized protein LOC106056901 isoform X2 n=1 Tax=Biomphalaria glabrata TaxID=6526 RepID=A0A9W3AT98_BIOGL|nr:uncharacterized protein LOC106056901 isoform X2 [Biomphalaria glabrata]
MEFLLVIVSLLAVGNSQLIFEVTPQTISPGVTPSLNLLCTIEEAEEVRVLSISIFRKRPGKAKAPQEPVATINSLAPRLAKQLIRSPRLNVFGELAIEAEGISFLKVIWPWPRAEDLGLYICEAQVLGEFGELVSLKSETQLSTPPAPTILNPTQNRLLNIVQTLVNKLEGFDKTLVSLERRLDNVTTQAAEKERALLEQLATLANQTSSLLTEGTTAATTIEAVATTTAARRVPPTRRRPYPWRRTTARTTVTPQVATSPAAGAAQTTTAGITAAIDGKTTAAVDKTTVAAGETTKAAGEVATEAGEIVTPAGETTVSETTTAADETTEEAVDETTIASGETTVVVEETTPVVADDTTTALEEATDTYYDVTTLTPEELTEALDETTFFIEEFLETTTSTPLEPETTITITEIQLVQFLTTVKILIARLDAVNFTVLQLEERVNGALPDTTSNVTDSNKADTEALLSRIEELTTLVEIMNSTVIVLEEKLVALEADTTDNLAEVNETKPITNTVTSKVENETNETESDQATIRKMSETIEILTYQLAQFNLTIIELEERVSSYKNTELEAGNELENNKVESADNETETEPVTRLTLVATVEVLSNQLETVNATLSALENKLALLETQENKTSSEPAQDLASYFTSLTSSYFLFKGSENTDSYKAQAVCESKQLYLTEIGDQAEFNVIEMEIAPFVVDDWLVIIAGKRRSGRNEWVWQNSGSNVTYFSWAAGEPFQPNQDNDCLAITTVGGVASMVSIPCYVERGRFFFLCEKELPLASFRNA